MKEIREHLENLDGLELLTDSGITPLQDDDYVLKGTLKNNLETIDTIVSSIRDNDAKGLFNWFFMPEEDKRMIFNLNPHNITYIVWTPGHGSSDPIPMQQKMYEFIWDLMPFSFREKFQDEIVQFSGDKDKVLATYKEKKHPLLLMAGFTNWGSSLLMHESTGGFCFDRLQRQAFEKVVGNAYDIMTTPNLDRNIFWESTRLVARLIQCATYPINLPEGGLIKAASDEIAINSDAILYLNLFQKASGDQIRHKAAANLMSATEKNQELLGNILYSISWIVNHKQLKSNEHIFVSKDEAAFFLGPQWHNPDRGEFIYFRKGEAGSVLVQKGSDVYHRGGLQPVHFYDEKVEGLSTEIKEWMHKHIANK